MKKRTPLAEVLQRMGDIMGSLLTVQNDVTQSNAAVQRDLLSTRQEFCKLEERVGQRIDKLAAAVLPKPVPVHERLCRDCKHAVPEKREREHRECRFWRPDKITTSVTLDYTSAKCGHPSVLSRVSGEAVEYCAVERKDYGPGVPTCGSHGTRFERRGVPISGGSAG